MKIYAINFFILSSKIRNPEKKKEKKKEEKYKNLSRAIFIFHLSTLNTLIIPLTSDKQQQKQKFDDDYYFF